MAEETQYPLTAYETKRGQQAYARYSAVVETTWDGRELPTWEGLTDKIRKGWSEAGNLGSLLIALGKLKEAILRHLLSEKSKLDEVALHISKLSDNLAGTQNWTRRALAEEIKQDSPLAIELLAGLLTQTALTLYPPQG
jgi:hypothetical protein